MRHAVVKIDSVKGPKANYFHGHTRGHPSINGGIYRRKARTAGISGHNFFTHMTSRVETLVVVASLTKIVPFFWYLLQLLKLRKTMDMIALCIYDIRCLR